MKLNERLKEIQGQGGKIKEIEIFWEDDICLAFAVGNDGKAFECANGRTEGQATRRLTEKVGK